MANYKDSILDFFSQPQHSYEAVEEDLDLFLNVFGTPYGEFPLEFDEIFQSVKECRRKVDRLIPRENNDQVIGALKDIQRGCKTSQRAKRKITYYKNLVERLLYPNWPESFQLHFDTVNKIVSFWKDCFFSYSRNKNAAIIQNPEDINNRYKKFIRHVFGAGMTQSPEWKKENLLAKAIIKQIRKENLNDFYDINDITLGDNIDQEITTWCGKSFGLVQLVHSTMFSNHLEPEENWCFIEYEKFKNAHSTCMTGYPTLCRDTLTKRFYFLLAGKDENDVFPIGLVDEMYDEWIDHIKATLHGYIDPDEKEANIQLIKDLVKKITVMQLKLIQNIQDVPIS